MSLSEVVKENVTFLVIGAGAWGLALTQTLARKNSQVFLWDSNRELLAYLQENRKHPSFCPNIEIHQNIKINFELSPCKYKAIFLVTPFQSLSAVSNLIQSAGITADHYICASKGISKNHFELAHQILKPLLVTDASFIQLSGPSFAAEVMSGLPTAVTLGYKGINVEDFVKNYIHQPLFRTYLTDDYIGVEVGGALKNVIAIAVGISDGLALGSNARAALIVRGLNEIRSFGLSIGGEFNTFSGLSGLGDLVLTATDDQSRNRQFGKKIAEYNDVSEALNAVGKLVEGYQTSQALDKVEEINREKYPIISEIIEILLRERKPSQALDYLLSREPRSE